MFNIRKTEIKSPIIVAPIQTWMPKSGIAAIEKEVRKDLGIPSNAK